MQWAEKELWTEAGGTGYNAESGAGEDIRIGRTNGSGKTTWMKMVAGLVKGWEGRDFDSHGHASDV